MQGFGPRHHGWNPYENVLSPSTVAGIDEDWSYATLNLIGSSPAVVGGMVYVGSDDDSVYALKASTGANVWSFTTGSDIDSSPAVSDGAVYIGSFDHKLYRFDLAGGIQGGPAKRPTRAQLHPDRRLTEQR